ncbi:YihY/virulence factor BrkB family protein [Roseobacter sp. CCS2]|uniref:YihY/virulence factor BrkB family protein n=1 Tax=Roseobacter sp. CCS2 TaxID=391593 RepID=UPI0000F3F11E|nr:YihY/virulence factor BrkB family protein [Roseobacter sp. CCS2]EBA11170.1 ribonuclease BN, putative [Roseobacter sp. CCS2]
MSRGRNASSPSDIPGKGWKDIALRLKDEVSEDRVGLIAAGVAFYGLLALFPAITAILAIGGLLVEPNQIIEQLSALAGIVPEAAMTIITEQATAVAGSREGGLGLAALLGIGLAIYSASKGMGSLMDGMNVAYDEIEERGFIRLKLETLGLTLLLIIGLLIGLSAMIAVPVAINALSLGVVTETLGTVVVIAVLLGLTLVGLAVLYRYGPSRDAAEMQWATPGAIAACFLWLLGSAGFAFYVANFGSYNESFGALGGVVILLMWLWISAYVIILGAELNAEMEAQTRHDTTVGQDRPMGSRDAEKADNLGDRQHS